MIFKTGVRIEGIKQVTFEGMCDADRIFKEEFDEDLRVTSVCDSDPNRITDSLHPDGKAFDCNQPWWTNEERALRAKRLQLRMKPGWQIIDKHKRGITPHVHCEFDPKP